MQTHDDDGKPTRALNWGQTIAGSQSDPHERIISPNEMLAALNTNEGHPGGALEHMPGVGADHHLSTHEFFHLHDGATDIKNQPDELAPRLQLGENEQTLSNHDDSASLPHHENNDHDAGHHVEHHDEHHHDPSSHQHHHRSHHHHHPHPSRHHGEHHETAAPAPSPAQGGEHHDRDAGTTSRSGQTTSTPAQTTSASSASPAPATSPGSLATSLSSKMAPVADTVKQHAGEAALVAGSVAAVGGAALGARRALKATKEQNKKGTTKSKKSSDKTPNLHGDVKKSQRSKSNTKSAPLKEKMTEELPSVSPNLQVTQDDEEHAQEGQTASNDNYEDELSADKGGKDRTSGDAAAEEEQQRPVDDLHADSRSSFSKTNTSPEKPKMSSGLKTPSDAETTPTSASSSASSPASTPRSSSATPRRGNLRGTAAFLQKLEKMEQKTRSE